MQHLSTAVEKGNARVLVASDGRGHSAKVIVPAASDQIVSVNFGEAVLGRWRAHCGVLHGIPPHRRSHTLGSSSRKRQVKFMANSTFGHRHSMTLVSVADFGARTAVQDVAWARRTAGGKVANSAGIRRTVKNLRS